MYDSKIILSLSDLQIKILCSRIFTIIKKNYRWYLGKILKLLPIHHCEEKKHKQTRRRDVIYEQSDFIDVQEKYHTYKYDARGRI